MPRKKKSKPLFIVVPARVNDLMEVQQIQNDCFPGGEKSLKWFMTKLGDETQPYACNVAKIAGSDAVVGFTLSKLLQRGYVEILGIGVKPMYRRQGIGRLMLAHLMDDADGVAMTVTAYVPDNSDYLPAQVFLRECGFPVSRIDRKKGAIKFERELV